jgi:hypothetical protein
VALVVDSVVGVTAWLVGGRGDSLVGGGGRGDSWGVGVEGGRIPMVLTTPSPSAQHLVRYIPAVQLLTFLALPWLYCIYVQKCTYDIF